MISFGLFCTAVIVGWFIAQGGKAVGNKISELTAGHSGCSVKLTEDGKYYDLWYLGPNNHIETAWVENETGRNKVESLTYDNVNFMANIVRRGYTLKGPLLRNETVTAKTLKELADIIDKKFKAWDFEEKILNVR